MYLTRYLDPNAFYMATRIELEAQEAKNCLMLGICGQLIQEPGRYPEPPSLKTVHDQDGLVLAALMTPPYKPIIYAHQGDLQAAADLIVEDFLSEGISLPGVLGESVAASVFVRAWELKTGRRSDVRRRSRLFELHRVKTSKPETGCLRCASLADLELVSNWWYSFQQDISEPTDLERARESANARLYAGEIYLWEDQLPVSMVMKTRPTRNGISVSLVFTPPDLRNRGYATACVGEFSRKLLTDGRQFCALFADVANAAANRVYERIGYQPISDYIEYGFYTS